MPPVSRNKSAAVGHARRLVTTKFSTFVDR